MYEQIINENLIVKLSAEDIRSLIEKHLFGKNGCSSNCEICCTGAEVTIPLVSNTK